MTRRRSTRRKLHSGALLFLLVAFPISVTPFVLRGDFLQASAVSLVWVAIASGVGYWFDRSRRRTRRQSRRFNRSRRR